MIAIEARRLAIEMSSTDFGGTISCCEKFMGRNGLCTCEDNFSGSDDGFLGFYDE
jgi:hypothetical protein